MRYSLRLFKSQERAKLAYKSMSNAFKDYPDFKFYPSDLRVEGQGLSITFRGPHNLESYIRGRMLYLIRFEEHVTLEPFEMDLLKMSVITSKHPKPILFYGEKVVDSY